MVSKRASRQIGTNMPRSDRLSIYSKTDSIVFDGQKTIARWKKPRWLVDRPAQELIQTMSITNDLAGRPDLISSRVYGTPLLDWVIISFNNPVNILNWPETGSIIEYPSQSLVLPELL